MSNIKKKQRKQTKKNKKIKNQKPQKPNLTWNYGGELIEKEEITNGEIIAFILFRFIPETNKNTTDNSFIKVIDNNIDFINGLHEEIQNKTLKWSENKPFRKCVVDLGQWLLFDFNPQFTTCIFQIFYNILENSDFLNDNVAIDIQYELIVINIQKMIETKQAENMKLNTQDTIYIQNDNIILLLRIFLRFLNIPNNRKIIMETIIKQKTYIIQYKSSILCVVKYLINHKTLQDVNVRSLITDYVVDKSINKYTVTMKLGSLLGNCGYTAISDQTKKMIPMSNFFSKTPVANKNNSTVKNKFSKMMSKRFTLKKKSLEDDRTFMSLFQKK